MGLAFKTEGDANEDANRELAPTSALVGSVTFTIPYTGYVIVFIGTRLGLLLLVVIPLWLFMLGELYDIARAARTGRNGATEQRHIQQLRLQEVFRSCSGRYSGVRLHWFHPKGRIPLASRPYHPETFNPPATQGRLDPGF